MHMPSGILPSALYLICNIIAVLGVLYSAIKVNKQYLKQKHVLFQTGVVFLVISGLYLLYVGTKPGMTIHWLGVMMTVMMFGPWLAVLLLSAVHITFALGLHIGGINAIGFNITFCVLAPAAVAALVHVLVYYKFPRTFPVYIIKVGVGDLLCMLTVDLLLTAVLRLFMTYPSFVVWQDFSLLMVLMGGMEAVISTWIASLLVCFLPSWLVTFNDEEYIHGK